MPTITIYLESEEKTRIIQAAKRKGLRASPYIKSTIIQKLIEEETEKTRNT